MFPSISRIFQPPSGIVDSELPHNFEGPGSRSFAIIFVAAEAVPPSDNSDCLVDSNLTRRMCGRKSRVLFGQMIFSAKYSVWTSTGISHFQWEMSRDVYISAPFNIYRNAKDEWHATKISKNICSVTGHESVQYLLYFCVYFHFQLGELKKND